MSSTEINLEVLKIIVSALTPLAIAAAGYIINRAIKTREHALSMLRNKQDMRKEIYDEVGPKLNQIFCFIMDVGDFGDYEPPYIQDLKGEIDRKFKTFEKLWHQNTINAYDEFMKASYAMRSGGLGTRTPIRTPLVRNFLIRRRADYFRRIVLMTTASTGTSPWPALVPVLTLSIFITTSMPSVTLPKTA